MRFFLLVSIRFGSMECFLRNEPNQNITNLWHLYSDFSGLMVFGMGQKLWPERALLNQIDELD